MSAEYPVVAFLQNCWFRPGTNPETIRRYLAEQKFRRIVLELSMTGRRLSAAFGERYHQIWWDNASEYVASTSPGRGPADPVHMARVLELIKPRGIVCFGAVANDGMTLLNGCAASYQWHYCPHPNARGIPQHQFNTFAAEIIARYF